MLLFLLISVFMFMFISNNKVFAASQDEIINYFSKYGSAFVVDGKLGTTTSGGFKAMDTGYLSRKHAVFGTHTDYSIAPGNWGANKFSYSNYGANQGGSYRFIGLTYRGLYPFVSASIDDDFDSTGDTKGRNYANWRTENIRNNTAKPQFGVPWNDPQDISTVLSGKAGNYFSEDKANELYKKWVANFDDHYALKQYYMHSPSFKKSRSTINEWQPMSFEKKRNLALIMQIPTSKTTGKFIEWHSPCGNGGHCYDIYGINAVGLAGEDFEATKLDVTTAGTAVNVKFTVKYNGEKQRDLKFPSIDQYMVYLNGDKLGGISIENSLFPTVWEKGQTVTVDVGQFDLGYELLPTDILTVSAEFNYEEVHEEDDFDNNFLSKTIKGLDDEVCPYGGVGEAKDYEVQVCGQYKTITISGTNTDGSTYSYPYTYCAKYVCETRTYNLKYGSEVKYDRTRQDLMGLWSSNSFGHLNLSVPGATVSKPSNEEWRKKIEGHKVPGVDNLRRVLRAGRSIQLYGTVSVKITLEDYKESGLKSKRDKFYNALTKHSIIEGTDEGSGKVSNNVKETKDTVKYDSSRFKVQSKYIKYKEGEVIHTEYGYGYASSGKKCTVIDVYTQTFEFELPLRSNNLGGEQITSSKGDFYTSKNYNISSSKTDSYFVDINTQNGVHSVNFMMKMYEIFKEVDSNFSGGTKLCKSLPEKFGIQGNIYDDTRVEDVTEEEEGKTNFNF